mmetsp:Transcript_23226/g.65662  ORF Transcript_23226/g.65662 Transcript_23226/m.65662 type:complete len:206 (+) Transcript_23226:944-1561(+)
MEQLLPNVPRAEFIVEHVEGAVVGLAPHVLLEVVAAQTNRRAIIALAHLERHRSEPLEQPVHCPLPPCRPALVLWNASDDTRKSGFFEALPEGVHGQFPRLKSGESVRRLVASVRQRFELVGARRGKAILLPAFKVQLGALLPLRRFDDRLPDGLGCPRSHGGSTAAGRRIHNHGHGHRGFGLRVRARPLLRTHGPAALKHPRQS